jgi:hypothetical protein
MSYDTLKETAGAEPFERVTVYLDQCEHAFSVSPCTATGESCFNSWETCRDRSNYSRLDKPISFCTATAAIPKNITDIPFLSSGRRGAVNERSGEPDPMRGMGRRGSITVSLIDAVHDDVGIDPYVSQRAYDPMERGTFYPRLKARFPFWKSRVIEWESGYLDPGDGLYYAGNFQKKTFIIDSVSNSRGRWNISAKDPLRLADDKLSKCPRPSRGTLAEAFIEGATPTTIDIATPDPTEYAFESFETFSAVRIGKQVFKYTGTTPITGGVRLTGVTRTLDDDYTTESVEHDIGNEVQKCVWFRAMPSVEVVKILMVDFAGVQNAWVPYADWLVDYTTWQAGFTLTRLITEPEGVKTAIEEIIQQSGTWAYWWEPVTAKILWSPIRPPDIGETYPALSDRDSIVADSITRKDEPENLINEYYILFGQRDPTKKKDDVSNYRSGILEVNQDSQSANEDGEIKTEIIYGRWHTSSSKANFLSIVATMIKTSAGIPFTVEFELHKKDDSIKTADFVTMESLAILNEFGSPADVRLRVVRGATNGETVKYKAIQDFFRGRFGRIAPAALDGLLYSAATDAQKEEYFFIADSGGLIFGDPGYELL